MGSQHVGLRPNLTKLVTRWFQQHFPNFKYTTIQFNKNYATKMHVDGNNEGPSYIAGFGDYTGVGVWVMDEENGTVEMEIKAKMKGYPQLNVGDKVKGRILD